MRIETRHGYGLRTPGQWSRIAEQMQQSAKEADMERKKEESRISANVVGGSLDGETMPKGTRDGQQYRWDALSQRWVFVQITVG